jgi:AcrR family transcriptional regulator
MNTQDVSMTAGKTRKRGQHHGNAREALLMAAAELLEVTGATNLSLRGIAERAGLSRQAPYNHFADKEAMLADLVVLGFERLASETGAASASLTGEVALAAASEAYIAFAQDAPALFRLMFACELIDTTRFADVTAAGARAFSVLRAVVATIVTTERVEDVSLAAWCIVHGYATLCIETGLEPRERRAERAHQFAAMIAA